MTNDSYLFRNINNNKSLPLYEGKMIHQFKNHFAEPKYWINENDGRKAILGRSNDNNQVLDYQCYRLGFRDIASSTNERTFISTITPKVFHGNKLPQFKIFNENNERLINDIDLLYLCVFFNSFVVDWHVRTRITSTLNFHYVYQTPIPRLTNRDKWYFQLEHRAARLICTTAEYAELWEEVMKTKWTDKVGASQEDERNRLRAELDGIIAHIYGLTEEEFTYILSTFPIVPQVQKVAPQNAYRDVSNGVIK